jgi:cation diffusion facilitator family transporter
MAAKLTDQSLKPPGRQAASQHADRHRLRMKAIVVSLLVGIVLLAVKFWTYRLTLSSAILSDALESIINVAASAFATLSIWMAAKPPDIDHPYGHGKIEYFSAGFEGALIIGAAIGIFYSGIRHLLAPQPLPNLPEGIGILTAATAVNLLLALFLLHTGRRTDSIALKADGMHILTDVITSSGVVFGLVLVALTGWLWLDGTIACLVGLNILVTGGKLLRQSFARLMDASDPALLDRLTELIDGHRRPGWIDIHQLRAWQAGSLIHVDLHLVLPKDAPLFEAHCEAKALERMLIEQFQGNISVLVHMDPCEVHECPVCGKPDCGSREHLKSDSVKWEREHLTRTSAYQNEKYQ